MALSFVFLRCFSVLHWIECFLAQHTLQDLHRILMSLPGLCMNIYCKFVRDSFVREFILQQEIYDMA